MAWCAGGGFNVLIIQYEMVMKTEDLRMLKTLKWSYCIVDEGHRLKNKDSKLFTVLTKEYQAKVRVGQQIFQELSLCSGGVCLEI